MWKESFPMGAEKAKKSPPAYLKAELDQLRKGLNIGLCQFFLFFLQK